MKYQVINTAVRINGKTYPVGSIVETTPEIAQSLPRHLEALPEQEKAPDAKVIKKAAEEAAAKKAAEEAAAKKAAEEEAAKK